MRFKVIIEKDEDGWFVGTVPSLPGCHSQAQSLDKLLKRIHEAIVLYIDEKGTPTG
jgi:predicted RNase H-like HicB family nuclease